jgi:hypothetical protein
MAKFHHDLSHAQIKAKILGMPAPRDRTGLVAAGNPDVIKEAFDRPDAAQAADRPTRLRSGPAWREGLRARPVEHHPGKMDGLDIGRKKVITY